VWIIEIFDYLRPGQTGSFCISVFQKTKSEFDLSGIYIYGGCQYYAQKGVIKMKTKFLTSALLALTITLAACAPKAAAPTKQVTIPTTKPPAAKPTTAPTKIIQATPTAKPITAPTKEVAAATTQTPGPALINDLVVKDQAIKTGSVLVNMVDAMKPGWVAIFTDKNDQPDVLLGYTAVPAGSTADIKVTVDVAKATDKMIAMLLLDAGKIGTFEYPGPDEPVKNANINTNVMAVFNKVTTSQ
jgi:hypothetical protein